MHRRAFGVFAILLAMVCQPVISEASMLPNSNKNSRYIVQLVDGTNPTDFLAGLSDSISEIHVHTEAINGFTGRMTTLQAKLLRSSLNVVSVESDYIIQTSATQTAGPVGIGSGTVPWGLDRLDQRTKTLDNSYTYGTDGTRVTAYVIDTGIRATHQEFGTPSRVVGGWSYLSNASNFPSISCTPAAGALVPVAPSNFDVYTPADVGLTDNHGHGTHIAGTIGGATTGIAKNVTMVAVRALNSCGSTSAAVGLQAIEWVIANHVSGPAVANMSFGLTGTSSSLTNAVLNLIADGVTVVAAAGNGSNGVPADACSVLPASATDVISVAASDIDDKETSFTNYGSCVDIFAPGHQILSASHITSSNIFSDVDYSFSSGTSMAAPHVTGVVARLLDCVSTLTPAEVWLRLKSRATPLVMTYVSPLHSPASPDVFLYASLPAIAEAPCSPRTVSATPEPRAVTISWPASVEDNGSSITAYTVALTPGGQTCSTLELSCSFAGLQAGTTYTVTVTATNAAGASMAVTTTAIPTGQPAALTKISTSLGNQWIKITLVDGDTTDTVYTASTRGGKACIIRRVTKSCRIKDLKNGSSYAVTVSGATSTATVPSMLTVRSLIVGGIQQKVSKIKRGKTLKLAQVMTTQSTGKKSWKITKGTCSITTTILRASPKSGVCRLRVTVAKTSKFPSMVSVLAFDVS